MSARQMAERCPGAALVGAAVVPGFRIAFDRFSERWQGYVADIVECPGSEVHGLLWRVTGAHLASLDEFEGVAAGRYMRREVTAVTPPGATHTATAYVVVAPVPEGEPSGAYLETITLAAREHGLPTPWLRDEAAAAATIAR